MSQRQAGRPPQLVAVYVPTSSASIVTSLIEVRSAKATFTQNLQMLWNGFSPFQAAFLARLKLAVVIQLDGSERLILRKFVTSGDFNKAGVVVVARSFDEFVDLKTPLPPEYHATGSQRCGEGINDGQRRGRASFRIL